MSTLQSTTASKSDEVRELYNAGWRVVRIANALGISPQGVYWHLRRLELPNPTERDEESA